MTTLLTDHQRETLTVLLDRLVPPRGEMPGAGQIGVADYVESVSRGSPRVARTLLDTLKQVDAVAGSRHQKAFRNLSGPQQDDVIKELGRGSPDLFRQFVGHTYSGYYTNPEVVGRLGADAGPPQPRGFPIKPFDPSIVDQVRKLGSGYRAV